MPHRPQKPLMMLLDSKGELSAHAHLSDCSDDGSSGFCYLSMLSGGRKKEGRGERLRKREEEGKKERDNEGAR